jgi:hypothetical protein
MPIPIAHGQTDGAVGGCLHRLVGRFMLHAHLRLHHNTTVNLTLNLFSKLAGLRMPAPGASDATTAAQTE